jgi:hypothetical protein
MRLGGKMEYRIDLKPSKALYHIGSPCYVAMVEMEIRSALQHPRVVSRTAVVQLVKGDDVVMIRVLSHKMSNKPGGAIAVNQFQV